MKISGYENTITVLSELGNRIKDYRISSSLTREELAQKAGTSVSTIVRLESGTNIGTEALINVLRSLNILGNIDLLVPEYQLTPMDIVKGKKKRKRATSLKVEEPGTWRWGDEK